MPRVSTPPSSLPWPPVTVRRSAALDLQLAAELLCAGAPAWVAAGVLLSGVRMDAEVLYAEVPFGVQYIVAGWSARG